MANRKAPIRWSDQLVEQDECALHARIGNAQVRALDDAGQHRAAGRIGEGLGRAQNKQSDQHEHDADVTADYRESKNAQDQRPKQVGDDHHSTTLDTVGDNARHEAEQQRRQVGHQQRKRDEQRVARL